MSNYFSHHRDGSRHEIFPGVEIFTRAGKHLMLSLVEFQPGAVVEEHSHPHEQAGMVLEGRAHFFVGDEDRVLGPGDMYTIPGNVNHRVVALDGVVKALDIFHPVREDYL
jgi:unsaturated pyranuronate lyase